MRGPCISCGMPPECEHRPECYATEVAKQTDERVEQFLDSILSGDLDDYLEAILAAGHARKRQRRGVRRAHGLPRV